jgi:hypothetical protein
MDLQDLGMSQLQERQQRTEQGLTFKLRPREIAKLVEIGAVERRSRGENPTKDFTEIEVVPENGDKVDLRSTEARLAYQGTLGFIYSIQFTRRPK